MGGFFFVCVALGVLLVDLAYTYLPEGPMKPHTTWIRSQGETPHCGSGRRLVVAEVGRKWARLRPASRPAARADRVPVETFQRIVESEEGPQ